ncbi:MAG: HEAT repeat domain-containing protein [Chloroflexota bacterium]
MSFSAITIAAGTALAGALTTVAVEMATAPAAAKAKDVLERQLKSGKYEAIETALAYAEDALLSQSDLPIEPETVSMVIDNLLNAEATPLVTAFATHIPKIYLFPQEETHDVSAVVSAYRKASSQKDLVAGNVPSRDTLADIISRYFTAFQEELLKNEHFTPVREYFSLMEERRQTDLLARIADKLTPKELEWTAIEYDYREFLQNELGAHTIRGFSPQVGGGNVISLPLSKIFLPLRAAEGRPALAEYAEGDLLRQTADEVHGRIVSDHDWQRQSQLMERRFAQLRAKQDAEKQLELANFMQTHRSVLLGDPGTGKTTITRYITYALAARDATHVGEDVLDYIPVLIRVANYARAFEQDSTLHVIEYIEHELTSRREFGQFLSKIVHEGKGFVIFDGLDEVADVNLRMRVTDQIHATVASFSQNQFLVTSRIVGYEQSPLTNEFKHATLQDLRDEDKKTFVNTWYDAIRDELGFSHQDNGAESLTEALDNKPQISRLAANPLLLTIMVLMHWRGTKLPSRRVQVYQTATDTLIEYWTAQRSGIDLDAEEVKGVLAPIAHQIISSSVSGVISKSEFTPLFEEGIMNERGCSKAEARRIGRELLRDLNEQSGLFLERGLDENHEPVYGFLHQTFGEYLAALYLAQKCQEGAFELEKYIHQDIWCEPLMLLMGHLSTYSKPQANALIREMMDFPAPYEDILHRNLLLVADCLADDIQIKPDIRDTILTKLSELLESQVSQLFESVIDIFKKLRVTRYKDSAIQALQNTYPIDDINKMSYYSIIVQYNIARTLVSLDAKPLAFPIIKKLDNDISLDGIRRYRFENWPDEAAQYLLDLQQDDEYEFKIKIDNDNYQLGPISLIRCALILGNDEFINLLTRLYEQIDREDEKILLKWILVFLSEERTDEDYLPFLEPDIPVIIRQSALRNLLDTEYRAQALIAYEELVNDSPYQYVENADVIAEAHGRSDRQIQFLRDTAFYAAFGNKGDAIIKLFEWEDHEYANVAAIFFFASFNRYWRLVKKMVETESSRQLGITIAWWMSLHPGYSCRWEASELLLEHGELEKAATSMKIFIYECHDTDADKAVQKLITLREHEAILPLLQAKLNSSDPTEQYQASFALAKYPRGIYDSHDSPLMERIVLKQSILQERTQLLKESVQYLCEIANSYLTNFDDISPDLSGLCELAFFALGRLSTTLGLTTEITKVTLEQLAYSQSPIARLRANWAYVELGQVDRVDQITIDLLKQADKLSPQLQSGATNIQFTRAHRVSEVPTIVEQVMDSLNSAVLCGILNQYGVLGQHETTSILIQQLEHPHPTVRRSAITGLGHMQDTSSIKSLLPLLEDENPKIRAEIVIALAKIGNVDGVSGPLMEMVDDDDPIVRRLSIYALWLTGYKSVTPVIQDALQMDKNERVRWQAVYCLYSWSSDELRETFTQSLSDEFYLTRFWACRALGYLQSTESVDALIECLKDTNQLVRQSAIDALIKIGDERAIEAITPLLLDEESAVRVRAFQALHHFLMTSVYVLKTDK